MAKKAQEQKQQEHPWKFPRQHIIGHQETIAMILGWWQKKRMPHAILLTGIKGIGKSALAHQLAAYLVGAVKEEDTNAIIEEKKSIDSYLMNKIIQLMEAGACHQIKMIHENDTIKIEDIREIDTFLQYKQEDESIRIVLVEDVEKMTDNAANALLKTLEEPAQNTYFIMTTSALANVLVTVRSRSTMVRMNNLSIQDINTILKSQHKAALEEVWEDFVGGSLRSALWLSSDEGHYIIQQISTLIETMPAYSKTQAIALSNIFKGKERQEDFIFLCHIIQYYMIRWVKKTQTTTESYSKIYDFINSVIENVSTIHIDAPTQMLQILDKIAIVRQVPKI